MKLWRPFLLSLFTLIFLPNPASSNTRPTYFCSPELGTLAIQQNGRVKPLYVHASETIKYLTGQRKNQNYDPVTAYCLLSLTGLGLPHQLQLEARADHIDTQKLLELPGKKSTIPYPQLLKKVRQIRRQIARIKGETPQKKSLQKLLSQAGLYQDIVMAQNWLIPEATLDHVAWVPLRNFLTEGKVKEIQKENPHQSPFLLLLKGANQRFEKTKGKLHLLEYQFVKAHLPSWALLLTLLSLAALTLFRQFTAALSLAGLTVVVQTAIITLRVIISGRAPITNMYETVLFSGFGALILSLFIGHFKREKVFVYLGLAYNACTLMMMNFATGMLNNSISPLVPVLRDNFWLSTHVTIIIMSYGALALSWILANTVLIRKRFWHLTSADESYYSSLTYTCLKYGTIMLGAGIILGGVWADYSWGRFWGWDPKETWSLIAFCLYIAILHGRYTNWIPPHRFMTLTAAAFLSIMMAWFGVNYILAAGLHSYGFSEGGALFLGSFFIIQISLLLITNLGKVTKAQKI